MIDERQQAEFNDAIGYLNRLNALFYLCDTTSMSLQPHQWFHALMSLFRELSTEMKVSEIEFFEKETQRINKLLELNSIRVKKSHVNQVIPELYQALHKFEMEIRRIFKTSGLQMKMKDDASGALR